MTDREKIVSDEFYDFVADYVLLEELRSSSPDYVYQPIDGEIGIAYVDRNEVPPLGVGGTYPYQSIPKLYGLMQDTFDPAPLIRSGITAVARPPLSLTGRGVVVGFLDTGIRYEDEVFRKEDGTTRLLGIWDQTIQEGEPPAGILYGTEYRRDVINAALQSDTPRSIVPSTDTNGHGSALVSVAAGSLLNNGLTFASGAPDAELVMVKLRQAKPYLKEFYGVAQETECYAESDILTAIRYLESYAVSLYRPLVICIGLGTSMGDHEGHSVLADYLSSIALRRSRCVICAAGNEGNASHHYVGGSQTGQTESVEIRVDERERGFVMELWGKTPDRHAISLRTPGGEVTPQVDFRDRDVREFSFIYENTRVQVGHILVEQRSGEELIFFRFLDPSPGIWTVNVTVMGTGGRNSGDSFHLWLPLREFLRGETYFLQPSPYTTVLEPGNAREIITAGAYDDSNGSFYAASGRGYTRLGLVKPDFVAPGVAISTVNGKRTGTSMAAALTAGAAAQFLQWAVVEGNQPLAENRELRSYLIRGATRPAAANGGFTAYPNREEGFGQLNISGTFDVLAGIG